MSLKGEFYWIRSMRQGGRKAISFTLTCTNLFQSETIDAAIIDGTGQLQPMIFRQQTLKAKESLRFDFDTVDWDWCQGDTFTILDKKGQMGQKWMLNLKTYAPGECPDCHGTHKCRQCNGTGMIFNRPTHTYNQCEACNGTGICQTCFVPVRKVPTTGDSNFSYNPEGNGNTNSNPAYISRQRKIEALLERRRDLQEKLHDAKNNDIIMRIRGTDITSPNVCNSYATLIYRYETEIIKIDSQISQLRQMGY